MQGKHYSRDQDLSLSHGQSRFGVEMIGRMQGAIGNACIDDARKDF